MSGEPAPLPGVEGILQRVLAESVGLRAKAVVAQFMAEHDADLRQLPLAVVTDLVVQVAVGYLVGAGVVSGPPEDEPVRFVGEWRARVPGQLQPDVAQVLGGYRRLLTELTDTAGRRE